MMQSLNIVPQPARYFGLAGLLPFFLGAIACWVAPAFGLVSSSSSISFVLCAYGAVILSFLGGIRWGVAMQHGAMINDWKVVAMAMIPSLVAWPALLVSPSLGLLMVIAGLVLQYVIDVKSSREGLTPAWFQTLRTVLTVGAVLSLLLGWLSL